MRQNFLADDVVISSRVRLARNFKNIPFPSKLDLDRAFIIQKQVFDALSNFGDFKIYQISNLDENSKGVLLEKHLISKNLTGSEKSAVILNADESVSIMINEEDHIREQCIKKGLNLKFCYNKLSKIDDEIIEKCDIAYDKNLGFLTACPTNLGTGLRASCMLFLPALSMSGKMAEINEMVKAKKQTIRGFYGEGSQAFGHIFQISNQATLGKSEWEIIQEVEQTIFLVCEKEIEQRIKLNESFGGEIRKSAVFALKSLLSGEKITTENFMDDIAKIKLYLYLNDDKQNKIDVLDSLISLVQPCSLKEMSEKQMTEEETDKFRGEYLQKILKNVIQI